MSGLGRSCRAALLAAACVALGCAFVAPDVAFLSNRKVLDAISMATEFEVDPSEFTLVEAQVQEDAITFYYCGVTYPADRAWVQRFSEKSSEQDPTALRDVYPLLPIIQEGREGFQIEREGSEAIDSARLHYVVYTFQSPIRSDAGVPLVGRGIIGTVVREQGSHEVVYQVSLDNWGDRQEVSREDLEPFLREILK